MTYINCLWKKISISVLFSPPALGWDGSKGHWLMSPWQQRAPGEAVGAQPSTCCMGWDGVIHLDVSQQRCDCLQLKAETFL